MRERSSASVRITYLDREGVKNALKEHIAYLARRFPELEKAILFGSFVRGDAVPGSDIDLLLVLAGSDKPFLHRIQDYLPSSFPVAMEVFPYTSEEIGKMLEDGNHFLASALKEGLVLFSREEQGA
ncbi:MAG: nucleotidyltransferase domain-containing protein [Actinobacteria bacterium]|nr:nucleotidyltransferase domain-containing protein [Actinomycetota bacterium]